MLTKCLVDGRDGYKDENGMVYAVPVSADRAKRWHSVMLGKGFNFS